VANQISLKQFNTEYLRIPQLIVVHKVSIFENVVIYGDGQVGHIKAMRFVIELLVVV